jgi:hypothetical protein
MLRSLGAVAAGLVVAIIVLMVLGFLTVAALGVSPVEPPTPASLAANLGGAAIAAASGGAVAGWFAPHSPHGHVVALALVILLVSLPALLLAPGAGEPAWYGIAQSVVGPISATIGGYLAIRRAHRAGSTV